MLHFAPHSGQAAGLVNLGSDWAGQFSVTGAFSGMEKAKKAKENIDLTVRVC